MLVYLAKGIKPTPASTAMGYAVAFLECPLGYTHPTAEWAFLMMIGLTTVDLTIAGLTIC